FPLSVYRQTPGNTPDSSPKVMRKVIRITNPGEGVGFTSRQRAKRYVSNGSAEWVQYGISIRLVRSSHQVQSGQRSIDRTRDGYERASSTGMATLSELANLPMVMPAAVLGIGKRKGATRHTFVASQGF